MFVLSYCVYDTIICYINRKFLISFVIHHTNLLIHIIYSIYYNKYSVIFFIIIRYGEISNPFFQLFDILDLFNMYWDIKIILGLLFSLIFVYLRFFKTYY